MILNNYKEKLIFFYFPIFLFSLLPFFLITGPFLSDFSISIIGIIFLSYCYLKKNFSFFKNNFFYFFLIIWIYLLFNSLINNFNYDSLKISFFFIRYGIFIIAIINIIKLDIKIIKYFFFILVFCFSILVIDGFIQYFLGENIFGLKKTSTNRISSFFGSELILGSYLARIWPIMFGLYVFIYRNNDKINYFFLIIFVLSEVLIFLSGERVAFFYINLSAVFIIIFSKNLRIFRLKTFFFSVLLIIIVSYVNPGAKGRIIDHTLSQMGLSAKLTDQRKREFIIFTTQHTDHYTTAYKMFLDHKVLGVGVKNFRNFCDKEKYMQSQISCATHPHNSYIQILTETGLVGFLLLNIIFFSFIYKCLKHLILKLKNKNYFSDLEVCMLSGILIYLWPLIPTGNIFNNWLNIILCIIIVFLRLFKETSNRDYFAKNIQ